MVVMHWQGDLLLIQVLAGAKKSGPVAVTLNLRSQPRLPGSVVGEASMRLARRNRQDYAGHCPKVTGHGSR